MLRLIYLIMNKDNINIGIVSKGRLKNFTENLLKKKKLKIFSERGERDLFGKIKGKSNIRVLFLHAREIIEQLSIGNLDIGISGYDLLKESEINIQKKLIWLKDFHLVTPTWCLLLEKKILIFLQP